MSATAIRIEIAGRTFAVCLVLSAIAYFVGPLTWSFIALYGAAMLGLDCALIARGAP